MKTAHLKAAAIREHIANPDGNHAPGHWSKCPACARVYIATTTRKEKAQDQYRVAPSELLKVRTVYDDIFYIRIDARRKFDDGSPRMLVIYDREGTPMLEKRPNRESAYFPIMLHPGNICEHDRATWITYTNPDGAKWDYCPICSPSYDEIGE